MKSTDHGKICLFDPERVGLMFDAFGVGILFWIVDPWALPTAIYFHACGVNTNVSVVAEIRISKLYWLALVKLGRN